MPRLILDSRGQEHDPLRPRWFWMESQRFVQHRQGFVEVAVVRFHLGQLKQARREKGKLRRLFAQFSVSVRSSIAAAGPKLSPRKIPLGERASWLGGIVRPAVELLARSLVLRPIKLVELFENGGQSRIRRMMFDKIFERIVASLGNLQLQMRIRHRTQGRDQDGATGAFRTSQDRLVKFDGPLVMVELCFEPALEV